MRIILSAIFGAALIVGGCQKDAAEQAKPAPVSKPISGEQPNIVILLADDLGWADLGFRGSDIQTPNIDRLAAEGVHLERLYVMPICTPTRSALMTGRDPMKLGAAYAGFQPWLEGGISPQEHFMPDSFRSAGYQTAMVGKWHLGRATEPLVPNSRGFDHFVGHLNTQVDYYTHGVAGGYDLQENGKSIKREGEYATDIHGLEAAKYISELRDPDKPFFLYVPFLAPHTPIQAPDDLKAKYPFRLDRPVPKKTYAAMVDSLDQNVGRILDALDAEGISENTIVLFFSDNGGMEVFGADNGPFRGGKLETFEGGIRVGAVMRWPEKVSPGTGTNAVISVMDFFPTLAAAAGVEMQNKKKLDGVNRWSSILGIDMSVRGDLYFAANPPIYNRFHVSILEEKWKLVQIIDHQPAETLVENFLFDINADPGEQNNLAEQNPGEVSRMAAKIQAWRAQHPVNGVRVELVPNPGWRAPLDYAEAVTPASEINAEQYEGYVSGAAAKFLQNRYGDKGKLKYD